MPPTEDRELIELIVAATATLSPEAQEEVRTRIGYTAIHYDFSPSQPSSPLFTTTTSLSGYNTTMY